jgi:predicted ester cyclase
VDGIRAEQNVRAVRRLVAAWNSHDLERIRPFFHPTFENHQLPFPPVVGLDSYLAHCRCWFAAYPDFRIEIVTLFASGDLVCLETRAEGTRRKRFFGHGPSGAHEVNHAVDLLEFVEGKIARERGYWDFSVVTGLPAPMAGGHHDPRSPFVARESD